MVLPPAATLRMAVQALAKLYTSLVSAGYCCRQAGNHSSHGMRTQVLFPMAACKYAWIASAIDVPFPGRTPKNRHAARPTNPVGVAAVSSEPNRMGFPSASRTWSPLKTIRPLYLCWDGWSSKCFTPHRVSNSAICTRRPDVRHSFLTRGVVRCHRPTCCWSNPTPSASTASRPFWSFSHSLRARFLVTRALSARSDGTLR